MSQWGQNAREAADKASKSGLFIRLEGKGDTVKVAFLGEPVNYLDDYEGNVSSKIMFEVWDMEMSSRRVFDINAKHVAKGDWFNEIDQDGLDKVYQITRKGVGKETTYDLRSRGVIPVAVKGAINSSDPINLEEIRRKKHIGGKDASAPRRPSRYDNDPVEEIPISEDEAARLRERDETLPMD